MNEYIAYCGLDCKACEARRLGADKLYISAHSSKESHAAYHALGCTPVGGGR